MCVDFLGWALPGGGAGRCLCRFCLWRRRHAALSSCSDPLCSPNMSGRKAACMKPLWSPAPGQAPPECPSRMEEAREGKLSERVRPAHVLLMGEYGQHTDLYPWQTSQWSHQWKTKHLDLSLWFKDKNTNVVENTLCESPLQNSVWFPWEDEFTCSLKIFVRMKVVSICKMLFAALFHKTNMHTNSNVPTHALCMVNQL